MTSTAATNGTKTFDYKGRNPEGKVVKGQVDAGSSSGAIARMRSMGLSPISVEESKGGSGLQTEIKIPGLSKGVSMKDLSVMSRQMATMISAGLSLLKTLTILSEQTENKTLAKALAEVRTDIESGGSLSASFAKHSRIFPPLMIHLIRAGETGGFLENSLESVATNYEKEVKLRATIKSAMTYPVVVVIIAIVAVIAMLVFIVPIFEAMFKSMGSELPVPTQVLVVLSHNMVWAGPVIAVTAIVFAIWWGRNKNTERVRQFVDPLKLKIPVFGPLLKKVAIARFTRNFSTMLGAGVPILQALSIVGETSGNYVIEEALHKVADSVKIGRSIAEPLAEEDVFPSMVVQMVAVGEDSGSLEPMLAKISDFYDDEVEATTEQLTALIEPLMITFMGALIGGMIVALYMPIFSIFDEIK
ncbi:type II secretion system F family protein [Leifsonia flava]|uniref:Type II secretion system F family protein n=2 Tax=Orlajensenia leifsoniae TaxID=2561933 RepID=A0A4Y9RA53_9MICO|nr:type II secretion system F family protein [Leifsonia flava]